MGVGFKVGSVVTEVGTGEFLHSFFSTVSHHLEKEGWGSRFPEIMNELYQGKLSHEKAQKVIDDLGLIRRELKAYPPDAVIWDIEAPDATPPWGDNISDSITSLADYFVTSGGKDLFEVLFECFEYSAHHDADVTIKQTPPYTGEVKGDFSFYEE